MKSVQSKTAAILAGVLSTGSALAHPGEHGAEGLLATVAHLLGEHGYLLMLLLGIGLIAWRRTQRG